MYSKILALGLLFVSTACDAAVLPPTASITVGGRVFTDVKNLITLGCNIAGAASGNCTMRKPAGTAGYTPSGSNKFHVFAYRAISVVAAGYIYISYADNDVGMASGTAFTNNVYQYGDPSAAIFSASVNVGDIEEGSVDFVVPNGKYTELSNGSGTFSGTVYYFGYEEP